MILDALFGVDENGANLVDGKLKMLSGGKLGSRHADFKFSAQDFWFTSGKNGALYTFCMTAPAPGTRLNIKSLGKNAKYLGKRVNSVKLLGYEGKLKWKQKKADGLEMFARQKCRLKQQLFLRLSDILV